MARINVEDTLWSDPRFMKLCIKLGDQFRAAGAVLYAWKYAQKFWCPDKKPIPLQDFINSGLPAEIIACGLADEIEGGIKMKGSEEHFAWWFEKRTAGRTGGRISAQRPRNNKGQLLPTKTQAPLGECLVKTQPSISYSFSSSNKKEEEIYKSAALLENPGLDLADANPPINDNVVELVTYPSDFEQTALSEIHERLDFILYPNEDFLKREARKMYKWVLDNKHKAPKSKRGWSRFVNGWLERSWDRERKHIPTNKPKQQYEWDEEGNE